MRRAPARRIFRYRGSFITGAAVSGMRSNSNSLSAMCHFTIPVTIAPMPIPTSAIELDPSEPIGYGYTMEQCQFDHVRLIHECLSATLLPNQRVCSLCRTA